ncbi:NADH-quinone oxidoreductase subunit J [Nitrospira sp. BLG_2]|uniref:NADH-quinone oxidoreductase subunit J n=1 Tax=Nitrospira sp. BLG_2 TaxID=3397507 RepID=UPI003B9C1D8F
MELLFYIAASVAVVATLRVITCARPVHALLYLVVSLLAVAVIFFILGAPFVAALEVIIYAGAIMVLFVFVVMMLNLGPATIEQEQRWMAQSTWTGPSILALILLGELLYLLIWSDAGQSAEMAVVGPKEVSRALFGPYLLGVELASLLLLPGLVSAYHLGRRIQQDERKSP